MNTPLTTSKGKLVNAVFGFWSIVLRGFQDVKPDYVIAAFDLSGPTFRHEQFADYKATRRQMPDDLRDQFPIVRQIIEAFGIPIYQMQGFEADDLIAALVKQAEAQDVETTIVSGDLDLLQLVSDKTTLMTTRGGVQQTVYLRPGEGDGALRPRAQPDDRLQGAQGRYDRQHPGHSRRRREDRGQAGPGLRLGRRRSTPTSTRSSRRSCA